MRPLAVTSARKVPFDAVAIRMKNGQHFALGTDEPEQLVARLKAAQAGRTPS